jgi:hypothetical protein
MIDVANFPIDVLDAVITLSTNKLTTNVEKFDIKGHKYDLSFSRVQGWLKHWIPDRIHTDYNAKPMSINFRLMNRSDIAITSFLVIESELAYEKLKDVHRPEIEDYLLIASTSGDTQLSYFSTIDANLTTEMFHNDKMAMKRIKEANNYSVHYLDSLKDAKEYMTYCGSLTPRDRSAQHLGAIRLLELLIEGNYNPFSTFLRENDNFQRVNLPSTIFNLPT